MSPTFIDACDLAAYRAWTTRRVAPAYMPRHAHLDVAVRDEPAQAAPSAGPGHLTAHVAGGARSRPPAREPAKDQPSTIKELLT